MCGAISLAPALPRKRFRGGLPGSNTLLLRKDSEMQEEREVDGPALGRGRAMNKAVEFCVRVQQLAKELDVHIKTDNNDDLVLLPTYTKDGCLDQWFVIYVNPWRMYSHDFIMSSMNNSKTQETQ
jgi:hypothetical protein